MHPLCPADHLIRHTPEHQRPAGHEYRIAQQELLALDKTITLPTTAFHRRACEVMVFDETTISMPVSNGPTPFLRLHHFYQFDTTLPIPAYRFIEVCVRAGQCL